MRKWIDFVKIEFQAMTLYATWIEFQYIEWNLNSTKFNSIQMKKKWDAN
jgi:hypothetical protein